MLNVKNKSEAIKNFFGTYAHDINGDLNDLNAEELKEYLDSDIFIGCASAATGIIEQHFVDWAVKNVHKL
jgi:hypothetical protein